MDWYFLYPLIIFAGFCTGYVNTLAGSGAAFSLIALNTVGLPLDVANATTRVGILFNTATAVCRFKKHGIYEPKKAITLAIPTICGSLIGVFIAVFMSPGNLKFAIGIVMIVILATLLWKPKAWLEGKKSEYIELKLTPVKYVGYFLIGIYGGFIQVGTGVFLLTALVLFSGIDLLRANSIKVIIIFSYTALVIIIFAFSNLINWELGIIMAIGNVLGAWVAAKHAAEKGAEFVRILLIIIVAAAGLHYLGIFKLIFFA